MPIDTSAITSQEGADTLRSFIANDGIVNFYIETTRKKTLKNIPIQTSEARFARQEFAFIDSVTGLRLQETTSYESADIYLFQVKKGFFSQRGDTDGKAAETAYFGDGRPHDLFWVYWEDGKPTKKQKPRLMSDEGLIRHELGHVVGLDHPNGDALNPLYSKADTIMSYNKAGDFRDNYPWTTSDILAMQTLWGIPGTGFDLQA